jgi:hypothetical protein
VGLYVSVIRAEELTSALAGDVLNYVYGIAAAVITLAGITLGILVSEYRAHSSHHRGRNDVLTGDKLKVLTLTLELLTHSVGYLAVILIYKSDRIH